MKVVCQEKYRELYSGDPAAEKGRIKTIARAIAVLICSNVVEQAIKKKLEDLGVEIKGEPLPSFKDIRRALGNVLKEKESRKLEAIFEPKELWRIRNGMDHWGYKLRFDKDKARAIFAMTKEIIDEIWRQKRYRDLKL